MLTFQTPRMLPARVLPLPFWRPAVIVGALLAYIVPFALARPHTRGELEPLTILPGIVGAAAGGLRVGILIWLLLTLLDFSLAARASEMLPGILGHALLLGIVVGISWLRTVTARARAQAASLAGIAADREVLRAAEAHRVEQREMLLNLTHSVLAAQSEAELLAVLTENLHRLVDYESTIAVYLLAPSGSGSALTLACADGEQAAALRSAGPASLAGALGKAIASGKPHVVASPNDSGIALDPGVLDASGTTMAVPLLGRDGPVGAVLLASSRTATYTAEQAQVALLFCNQAVLALENLRLSEAAAEASALRRLGQLKDELMRTVSHELRTPLSYVFGYAELLTASNLPARERHMVTEIYRAADHMRRVVDDLLDLDRIEAHQVQIDPVEVALAGAVEQAVDQVKRVESGGQHQFVVALDPALPPVFVDPFRLRQVLVNLLTNAVRYSPPETEVRVTAQAKTAEVETVRMKGSSGAGVPVVEVSVADQGAGLTPEQCERAFEKFYRGDVELTGKHPGAGLGLAICRGLVEAHGGRIWAESCGPGTGAVFRFTLPVAVSSPAMLPLHAAAASR